MAALLVRLLAAIKECRARAGRRSRRSGRPLSPRRSATPTRPVPSPPAARASCPPCLLRATWRSSYRGCRDRAFHGIQEMAYGAYLPPALGALAGQQAIHCVGFPRAPEAHGKCLRKVLRGMGHRVARHVVGIRHARLGCPAVRRIVVTKQADETLSVAARENDLREMMADLVDEQVRSSVKSRPGLFRVRGMSRCCGCARREMIPRSRGVSG